MKFRRKRFLRLKVDLKNSVEPFLTDLHDPTSNNCNDMKDWEWILQGVTRSPNTGTVYVVLKHKIQ